MQIIKKTEKLKVVQTVDVLVLGGGPAGVPAALAAARQGAKTLIIEQFNCLGGVATAAACNNIAIYTSWHNYDERIAGGIIWEMAERVTEAGYGEYGQGESRFEVEGMKLVLEAMTEEAGVEILYHTFFCETLVENGKATGAIIQSKDGRRVILAKQIIDCTGDGDAAYTAGCSYDMGDEETGHCQPVTLMFNIGGVNWEKLQAFRAEYHTKYADDFNVWKLERIYAEAQKNGDMRPFQSGNMGWWYTCTRPDWLGVNFTHVNHVDSTKAADLTKATIEARKQAYETIDVYRKYIPGMENIYMAATPNTIGLRESRRIKGLYTLTKDDVLSQSTFDDAIGYGSFFIDIHGTEGPGMDRKAMYPETGFKYQIPYRIMVPKDIDNMLTAGRCVSTSHEALGSIRVMTHCGVMGQAAGTAAALSAKQDISPKDIDIKELQTSLKQSDCILDENDIAKANQATAAHT